MQWFSTEGHFALQGAFGNVGRHFCLSQLGRRWSLSQLVRTEWRPVPTTKSYPAQNVCREVERVCYGRTKRNSQSIDSHVVTELKN